MLPVKLLTSGTFLISVPLGIRLDPYLNPDPAARTDPPQPNPIPVKKIQFARFSQYDVVSFRERLTQFPSADSRFMMELLSSSSKPHTALPVYKIKARFGQP